MDSSSCQIISFQGCDERGPALGDDPRHCRQPRFPSQCGSLDIANMYYPETITCWSNAHSLNFLNLKNLRQTDSDGHQLLLIFGVRPNQHDYRRIITDYNWEIRKKAISPNKFQPFVDLDFGITKKFGSTQIQISDRTRRKIESENLAYAASLRNLSKDTTRRLGPPLLTPSQEHTIASYIYHVLEPRPRTRTVWPIRNDDESNNAQAGPADPKGYVFLGPNGQAMSRLQYWFEQPPSSMTCYHRSFPYYNDEDERGRDSMEVSTSNMHAAPDSAYVVRNTERLNNWYPGKKYRHTNDTDHKMIRRRQVNDTMTTSHKRISIMDIIKK